MKAKTRQQKKTLICSCCGQYTSGRQWWNQDTGYGLCAGCVDWMLARGSDTKEGNEIGYGEIGVYCGEVKS